MSENHSRFCVGIDLGTTNSVLSYVDTASENPSPQTFLIPQLSAPGEISSLPALPSFIFLPESGEFDLKLLKLPWQKKGEDIVVGAFALEMAAKSPHKVVTSSKSWLCCDKIDRHSQCLPPLPEGENVRQISPVEAATIILNHLKAAWNHLMASDEAENRLENQEVIITVPASFDAVARDLTVEAANAVGLHFTLLEEPQAAFYSWLAHNKDTWRKQVEDGDVVLVCDIGGGTSDFSLIAVMGEEGDLTLQRLAVGDHTLLGGDNMDLTLAYTVSARLKKERGISLNNRQFAALTQACRKAKEALGSGSQEDQELVILGAGSGLIGGTITTKLSYDDLKAAILEGFFPSCSVYDKPQEARRSGLRSFSLDYAADPAFTKHLAYFLERHGFRDENQNLLLPGVVLFNGGVTKPALFRDRIVEMLQSWLGENAPEVIVLQQDDSDQAVAMGAAWLSYVKRSGGIRIKAGSPRSYYIGVESSMPAIPGVQPPLDALCVVNFGLEEGSSVTIDAQGLALVVGEPTEFRFFSSTTRHDDKIGDRIDANDCPDLVEMPPLQVMLSLSEDDDSTNFVPVKLRTDLTDIGTLQLWCDDLKGKNSWKLEFDIRAES
ncbi:MAG: Hsp70 family protein [Lentisphaeria bacterium]|nr:Hsp70 family protein [Lentisphaeria bacterium]